MRLLDEAGAVRVGGDFGHGWEEVGGRIEDHIVVL